MARAGETTPGFPAGCTGGGAWLLVVRPRGGEAVSSFVALLGGENRTWRSAVIGQAWRTSGRCRCHGRRRRGGLGLGVEGAPGPARR
jgi:hypothetical protein